MKSRVTVTVEMYDATGTSERTGGETIRWTQNLSDDNPRYSAAELEKALAEGTSVLSGKIALLRGDIRADRAAAAAQYEPSDPTS